MQIQTFQSTPPVKAATFLYSSPSCIGLISIHAAREGGDQQQPWRYKTADISIHAAREGGDDLDEEDTSKTQISIHAAREGGDYPLPM